MQNTRGWRGSPRPGWPRPCGRLSPWSPSWTRSSCSSTRWRRSCAASPRPGAPSPRSWSSSSSRTSRPTPAS